ncbi:MAG: YbaN family protein [Rhizobiales bacterium]|nr:YbaN family protein [Hyphomicrobiales bacterium]
MNFKSLGRPFFLGLGWLSVGVGIIGLPIPLFPTTVFLLVAAWAFSKSSPELALKLRNHRLAGPLIRGWQDDGVIPLKAKLMAVSMMAGMLGYLHFGTETPLWAEIVTAAVLIGVSAYIVTRPSRAPSKI